MESKNDNNINTKPGENPFNMMSGNQLNENAEKDAQQILNESEGSLEKPLVEVLKKEKQQLTDEIETLKNQYIRLAADFDNFRKRQLQEKQDMFKSGTCETIKTFLPIIDSFDRAYVSFKTLDDLEKLKESFNVLYRQIQDSLNKLQVTKIKTVGESFDPNFHEAVMREETSEYKDSDIIMELQCGYMLEDKVVRPSMVKVATNSTTTVKMKQSPQDKDGDEDGNNT